MSSWPLACPQCRQGVAIEDGKLSCDHCGLEFEVHQGHPMLLPPDLPQDMRLSIEAWDKEWAKLRGPVLKERDDEYTRDYLDDTVEQILEYVEEGRHRRYLEIGCGPGFLGVELSKRGFEVAGLDCCKEALVSATELYASKGQKGTFFGGDLHHIPLADGSVDFLYGGGVIEHFKDTLGSVKELHRVLAPGGFSFNTVPYVSVGSFTYRQIWGNIPDLPLIRPLFEWFHMRLLGGKHMRFGYEKSFTAAKMVRLHKQAGFSKVVVRRFKVYLPFYFLPAPLRPLARWLAKWRPFWPMIAVVGIK